MSGTRHLCGGRPSAGVHEGHRIQRDPGSPNKGLRRGGNNSEKGSVARRGRAKKSARLLTAKTPFGESLRSSGLIKLLRTNQPNRYGVLSFSSLSDNSRNCRASTSAGEFDIISMPRLFFGKA